MSITHDSLLIQSIIEWNSLRSTPNQFEASQNTEKKLRIDWPVSTAVKVMEVSLMLPHFLVSPLLLSILPYEAISFVICPNFGRAIKIR
jgi:hypothetical protein